MEGSILTRSHEAIGINQAFRVLVDSKQSHCRQIIPTMLFNEQALQG